MLIREARILPLMLRQDDVDAVLPISKSPTPMRP